MDVLSEFRAAIDIKRSKNLEDFEEQMNLPLDERITKGITICNLKVEFEFYDRPPNSWCFPFSDAKKYIACAKIYCDNNISKFKEGSSVILSNGAYRFEMNIEEDSTENFILKPNDFNLSRCYIDVYSYPKNNWEINSVHTNIGTKLLLTAADVLSNNESKLNKISNFLNGNTINLTQNNFGKIEHLNKSQNAAYLKAINASDFCLIQGPPGTGKTTTIGFIAKKFIDFGLKVFITAPTHTAINNCLSAISSIVKDSTKVVKIGEKANNKQVLDNKLVTKKSRLTYFNYSENDDLNQKGIAIGATAYSLCYPSSKKLDGWKFDVCIVDEASQLSIPLSIAAMIRTEKFIFVGDHKQLDPIIPKNTDNEMFAESVFSRLARVYPDNINLLNTSYRLNPSLIEIPNTLFYNNQLQSHTSLIKDKSNFECSYHPDIINGIAHSLVLHNVFDAKGRSPYEAKLVAELVSDLLQNGVTLAKIGVMSPYRAQVREVKKQIKKNIPKTITDPFKKLFVDTVDSMQGQERDYIIYTMSNSHPLESMRRLDFFYSPNRLNVAITRAIKKCFVIANYKVFDIIDEELIEYNDYNNIKEYLDIFKHYYSLSTKIKKYQVDDDEW